MRAASIRVVDAANGVVAQGMRIDITRLEGEGGTDVASGKGRRAARARIFGQSGLHRASLSPVKPPCARARLPTVGAAGGVVPPRCRRRLPAGSRWRNRPGAGPRRESGCIGAPSRVVAIRDNNCRLESKVPLV